MRSVPGILSILLALALAVSSVALSGHVSSHKSVASDYCSLCMQASGSDSATAPDSGTFLVCSPPPTPDLEYTTTFIRPVSLHDHLSRAPPHVT